VNRCLLHLKWPVIVPTRTLSRDFFILKNLLPAALSFKSLTEASFSMTQVFYESYLGQLGTKKKITRMKFVILSMGQNFNFLTKFLFVQKWFLMFFFLFKINEFSLIFLFLKTYFLNS
jgi:hypothetical protein